MRKICLFNAYGSPPTTWPPAFPRRLIRFWPEGRTEHEANKVYGRADYWGVEGGGGGRQDGRSCPAARRVGNDDLKLAGEVWRAGGI